jgi:hypothetical protein
LPMRRKEHWGRRRGCFWRIICAGEHFHGMVPVELIERNIYLIRGRKVMLDNDLADLYQVSTKLYRTWRCDALVDTHKQTLNVSAMGSIL